MKRKYISECTFTQMKKRKCRRRSSSASLYTDVSLLTQSHRCETLRDGEALCPGCEIQKPAAVQQKYRYDLNDLYGVFLENRDSRAQRSLIVLCAFCKGFQDTHTFCRSA